MSPGQTLGEQSCANANFTPEVGYYSTMSCSGLIYSALIQSNPENSCIARDAEEITDHAGA